MTKRGPLFKYFGSKYRSSKFYPPPKFPHIIEPFAGGAGFALRYREHQVTLVDLDAELVALWQWLIKADPAEIAAMPVTGLVKDVDIRTLGLSDGAAQLMRRWQRTGHCSSWTVSNITTGESAWCQAHGKGQAGGNTGMWHRSTRDYLCRAVTEIRHWQAFCANWESINPAIAPEATWFIDPPYQGVKYTSYKHGLRGIDYGKLAAWCRRLPGQVIVCEQQGADWLPFKFSHEVSGMRGKMHGVAGAKSQEVFWTNYPS
jgi:site-specific DNA-adenine methylase